MAILRELNFHLFDDGSVFTNATNVAKTNASLNVNVTGQAGLSAEMKIFYDRALLRSAEPELIHDQFAQKRPIPGGNGKTIEFRKFSSLPKALTPLTEGVTPDGQSYSVTKITATIAQYGAYIAVSDMLELTAFDNNMAEITRILGSQAGRTSDTITREVLVSGTNVMFADKNAAGHDSRDDITAADVLTVKEVKKARRIMKRNNVPTIGKDYVCLIHPDTEYDLMEDPEWQDASKYAGSEQIFNGEIGRIYGVRFIESTEAKIWGAAANDFTGPTGGDINAGATDEKEGTTTQVSTSIPIYATLMLGADAFGVTSINNGGIETIVKQLGSAGAADPLNQRSTVGWKMNKAVRILAQERLLRIEHTSTFTSAVAN